MFPVVGLVSLALGLVMILGDEHVSRAVWRKDEDPESGAATARMLGLVLFVAGGLMLLAAAS